MSTVTIPRELAQSLLVLMTRDATDADVPAGQWRTFADALATALNAPRNAQDAPGSTQHPWACPCFPRLHCDAYGGSRAHPACRTCEGCDSSIPATCLGTVCRFCRTAAVIDNGLCAPCADDLLHDAQELERSTHVCPRCDRA